jgi:hypothetical protein
MDNKNENENMDSAREAIEHGYGAIDSVLPLGTVKEYRKLGHDADRIYAETRVLFLMRDIITCLRQGNTCTGPTMFACPPPSLESHMNGTPHHR